MHQEAVIARPVGGAGAGARWCVRAAPRAGPGSPVGGVSLGGVGWSFMIAAMASAWPSSMSATIGVSITPGQTALMRMPLGAYSTAAPRGRRPHPRLRRPAVPTDPGLTLTAMSAEPGTASADGLKLLAGRAATLDENHRPDGEPSNDQDATHRP